MSATPLTLDANTTALVVIDLQHGIVAMDTHPVPSSSVVAQAKKLADHFRAHGAPVVLVTVGNSADGKDVLAPTTDAAPAAPVSRPPNWSVLVDDMAAQPGDITIMKRQWGAFYGTDLDLQLRRRGIRTLVLVGIATHVGVESTARDAFEHGYDQVFVSDAIASPSAEAHTASFKFTFPRIGRIRTADEVILAVQ